MRRELYQIPEHLDVDKIKSSREACFADRTAVHIKNGLTEVQLQSQAGLTQSNYRAPVNSLAGGAAVPLANSS